ncbi:MAG: DUF885 family protein [Parvularculaceae bacterium]
MKMIAGFRACVVAPIALFALNACGERAETPPQREASAETAALETAYDPSAAFLEMTDQHAAAVLRESPEFATVLGVSEDIAGEGYNARLGDYGFEANQRARAMNEQFLQELKGFDRSALAGAAAITYDVLRNAYETGAQRNQFQFGGATPWGSGSPYAVTQLSGPHLFLPRLLQTQQPLASKPEVEDYLSRLEQFGRVFDEMIEAVGADAALGVVPPYFALEGAVGSINRFTTPAPAENPLVTTLSAKMEAIDEISAEEREAYAARAAALVENVVYPAYSRLGATLEALVGQAGRDAGVWRLGGEGEAFYQHALNSYGAGGMTGDEIHELGLAEVARITGEMDAILAAQGLTEGTVAERFEAVGARPEMRYPNTDEGREAILSSLNAQVAEIMEQAPDWFGVVPSQSVEVRRIPVYEQDTSPGGYYSSPPLDGSRPGIYWINLKDTADWPKHTLKTLTYHEAVPGHHFQRSLERAAGLPLIRNMLGYSEFAEGWALYAEQVAAEMGMYENDPFGDLARLQSELFRAARLVVDSGLHAKQWTREQAIDYMVATTGDTRDSVTREIERYSVWPGQACSYKLGMLKIGELRAKAETELGDAFDIRDFHDEVLLTGSMPLPVLEAKIDRWIASKKGA